MRRTRTTSGDVLQRCDLQGFAWEVHEFALNSGLKISQDMTKTGSFHFGFVHLSLNGKIYQTKTFCIGHEFGTISSSVKNPFNTTTLTCEASVSVGLRSKERTRNGIFNVLPARKRLWRR